MLTSDKATLGLDIGGSSVKYGWGDCKVGLQYFGKLELRQKNFPRLRETVRQILDICARELGLSSLGAIGIGTPGTIDRNSGKIVGVNPNLPFWVDTDPRELIPKELGLPVFCDNDANLMCLAEAWLRGGRGSVAGITVGSGIGCGFVVDGLIWHGAHGFALELGHITSIPQGELCSCGRKGCLEAYASVEGLRHRLLELPGADEFITESSNLSSLLAFSQASPAAANIIVEGRDVLARGISDLIVILDPDAVVIGGGAMDGGLYPWNELKRLVKENLPSVNEERTSLEQAREGNRAGVLGAVILASQS